MMVIMRYPDGHKATVKRRIVRAASQALRRCGLQAVSIPALMKKAGKTHGGFYSHFTSRDELVAEAVRFAAEDSSRGVFSPDLTAKATFDRYLSKHHLDHPERGCVLAALGADGVRQPRRVRAAFAEAATGLLQVTERKLHAQAQSAQLSDRALVCAATMVGAIVLARLVADDALAERILAAARATVAA
jgi:TetR/AcrR family transcriptional regulator, transcriptional repressor for nem operon